MPATSTPSARRAAVWAALLSTCFLLATACHSANTTNGAASKSAPGGSAAAPQQAADQANVASPGPALNTASVHGKTVYWIPITTQAAIFSVEQKAAATAFATVGVKLQLCDGEATPGVVSKCVSQAIAAHAAGIIATSIPPEFAQQSFNSAIAAKIPLEFVNTKDATTPAAWGKLAAALPANFVAQAQLNDQLIASDSHGKGQVLLIGVTDSSVTTSAYQTGMLGGLKAACPGCQISNVQTSSTQISNLTSLVSSALVAHPNTQYVFVEFDSFAAPVVQAIRQLNKSSSIKLVTMLGQLDGLQRVKDGGAFADTGYSIAALGWNETDVMLRLMLGQNPEVAAHTTPIKTFTAANVGSLELTPAGWQSGKWETSQDFQAMFTKLWGVSAG